MREIKFRVWLKNSEVLTELIHLSFENKVLKVRHWENGESVWLEFDDVELLQYTGQKDKNGVEIYEGDIVEITHPFRQRHHVGEVIYDGYQFNVKGFLFPHYDLPNDAFSEGTIYIEVIGNIYENPELLEREVE